MRKWSYLLLALMLKATMVSAAAFTPAPMKLTAPATISYDFDGKALQVPVTLSGRQAAAIFCVNTKDKAAVIKNIRNGFLGWHYVNNIDTCLYVSDVKNLENGSNLIIWDGKDADKKMAAAGEYTYYIFGYDSVSARTLVCSQFGPRSNAAGMVKQYDEKNIPLAVPIYYPPAESIPQISVANGGFDSKTVTPGKKTRAKWVLGSDPMDSTLIETTMYMGWGDAGKIALMPGNDDYFFVENYLPKTLSPIHHVRKFKWVPNGLSEQDLGFGESGAYTFSQTSAGYAGPISDNISSLWVIVGDNSYPNESNPAMMYTLDPNDGSLIRSFDFKSVTGDIWWDFNEIKLGYKYHGGPTEANFSNGKIYCAGLSFCIRQCIDPYKENNDDVTLWYNVNGDYVGDRFFDPTAGNKAWMCSADSSAPWTYDYSADTNGFSISSAYDLGAVSFALFGPDGTGIGYFALPGETAKIKYGQLFVDCGSAYDGIYCDNPPDSKYANRLWYVANDSIKGIITSTPIGVKENAPLAFTVAQNVPNPFNPNTTISFTLAKAGLTTVEVYNTAGQKVDTILNANLGSGSHSVTWDASKRSAGVYFYTVRSSDFSKTLKMTLLK
ncbi:MAG: T9SS type A sorting domain-containing protein [Candidatus Latescibacterota bacterium]